MTISTATGSNCNSRELPSSRHLVTHAKESKLTIPKIQPRIHQRNITNVSVTNIETGSNVTEVKETSVVTKKVVTSPRETGPNPKNNSDNYNNNNNSNNVGTSAKLLQRSGYQIKNEMNEISMKVRIHWNRGIYIWFHDSKKKCDIKGAQFAFDLDFGKNIRS